METTAELQLLKDFRNGKEKAAAMIWKAFYKDLVYFSVRIINDHQAAEDIVSDGFIKLWMRRSHFDEIQKIKNFLFAEVHNQSINSYKARTRHDEIHQELAYFASKAVENEVLYAEVMGLFNEIMELLTPRQREIVTGTILDGKKGKEVAEEMMIHEAALSRDKKEAMEVLIRFAQTNSWRYPALLPYLLTLLDIYHKSQN